MADPTARFVLTAQDQTAAAFASANRGLTNLQRTARMARSILATFGVALSGRAFINWIARAHDAAKMTNEQKVATEQARNAMEGMREASDSLARSIGQILTPAMKSFAGALEAINGLINVSEYDKLLRKYTDLTEERGQLTKDILIEERRHASERDPLGLKVMGDRLVEINALLPQVEAQLESIRKQGFGSSEVPGLLDAQLAFKAALGRFDTGRETTRNLGPRMTERDTSGDEAYLRLWERGRDLVHEYSTELEKHKALLAEIAELRRQGINVGDLEERVVAEFEASEALKKQRDELKELHTEFNSFFVSVGATFQDTLADAFLGIEVSFRDMLKRMAAQLAASAIFSSFATAFGGPATFLGRLFGGFRAEGGPVSSGKAYMVGERGPELFMPGASGMIAAGAGGVVVNQYNNIDARGATTDVIAALPGILAKNREMTKAEIRHLLTRGRL